MKVLSIRSLLAAALLSISIPAAASAQEAARNVLSINPIGVVFSVYNLEFERELSKHATLALSTTYWGDGSAADDGTGSELKASYISADLKGRYYPNAALKGFSFGAVVGLSSLGGEVRSCSDPTNCNSDSGRVTALTGGVTLDYLARFGANESIVFGAGLGAKKLKPFETDIDAMLTYPFARLTLGVAF